MRVLQNLKGEKSANHDQSEVEASEHKLIIAQEDQILEKFLMGVRDSGFFGDCRYLWARRWPKRGGFGQLALWDGKASYLLVEAHYRHTKPDGMLSHSMESEGQQLAKEFKRYLFRRKPYLQNNTATVVIKTRLLSQHLILQHPTMAALYKTFRSNEYLLVEQMNPGYSKQGVLSGL
jgi:hypothetical protein